MLSSLKKKKKVNILMAELVNNNLGDAVIADAAVYMLSKAIPVHNRGMYAVHRYNLFNEDYEMVSRADMIIFSGGGIIKYKAERFYYYISKILEIADRRGIPVYFNGVGIEGFDASDEKCLMLKAALNCPCVKAISVRDDIDTLTHCYLDRPEDIRCRAVADAAVFTDRVYKIKRQKTSAVIGLGIVRGDIFTDHGNPDITPEYQLALWRGIIEQLEAAGCAWQLFTNGAQSDFRFAEQILEHLDLTPKRAQLLAPRPVCSRQLVEIISGYRAVIAGRMHANVIAYALSIPSVGLVWNDKLRFWGEKIGYPERFIAPPNLTAKAVTRALFDSMAAGVRKMNFDVCSASIGEMRSFISRYGPPVYKSRPRRGVQAQQNIVAVALGGADLRHSKLNTPAAFPAFYKNGTRLYEADLRLTADGRLICINGERADVFEKLGSGFNQVKEHEMDYKKFIAGKWLGVYPVADMESLIHTVLSRRGVRVLLDIGRPDKKWALKICTALENTFKHRRHLLKKVVIQVQNEAAAKAFEHSPLHWALAYYTEEDDTEKLRKIAAFCTENAVRLVAAPERKFGSKFSAIMHENGLKVYAFHYETLSDIENAVSAGADYVGSYYFSQNGYNCFKL